MSRVWNFRPTRTDRETKIIVNKCDICGERVTEGTGNLDARIHPSGKINNNYVSEYDNDEPRLILCDGCQKEYLITGYKIN
jgi:hypothetical protein